MLAAIRPPDAFIPLRNGQESFSSDTPPLGSGLTDDVSPPDNPTGRHNNRGLKSLILSDDDKTLWALMESALNQEGGLSRSTERYARLLKYDITKSQSPRYAKEDVVPPPRVYTGVSGDPKNLAAQTEILHVQNGQFLILAKDSGTDGPTNALNFKSNYRHIDIFDIDSAMDIKGNTYDCATCAIASITGVLKQGIKPATSAPSWT